MGLLSITPVHTGLGGMLKICLEAPDGARAEVYSHGAHVTSWIPVGGSERLFLSQKSEFRPGAAIRGGVPIIFPQFGGLGKLPRHGFARTLPWELASLGGDSQTASAKFSLQDTETTRQFWPHPFRVESGISVGGMRLELNLSVTNTGDLPFEFTGALHTYLQVEDILETVVDGLHKVRFHNTVNRPNPSDWIEGVQTDPEIHFPGEVDRVYYNVRQPLRVLEPGKITRVAAAGFPDVVIWNPGPEKSAGLGDMESEGYRHMVCVEAVIAGEPVKLEPGESWLGAQRLSA
jgi:glucose-6-phosphate 1-epimerase